MGQQGLLMLVFALATLASYMAFMPSDDARDIARRASLVRKQRVTPEDLQEEELKAPFSQRILAPVVDSFASTLGRLMPGTMMQRLRTRILEAGRPCSIERLIAMKVVASAGAIVFYAAVVFPTTPPIRRPMTILMAIVSTLIAFTVPDFWLSNMADKRKATIRRQLADVLDLLSVSVEAGLGFDGAIQKVSEKFKDPVSGEFKAYLAEVRLGKGRAEALRNLARRTDIPEMQAFVASVIQADQLGVSLTNILKLQSESVRMKRRQRAEERAMQAPVKMLFPLIFLIFPTLFLVLLGPVVIHWITTFKSFAM